MTTTTDPRPDKMKRTMAEHFDVYESDYRADDWCTVVFENDYCVIIADHKGHEHDEWRREFGDGFSEAMHQLARDVCDHDWSVDQPVVFDKLE